MEGKYLIIGVKSHNVWTASTGEALIYLQNPELAKAYWVMRNDPNSSESFADMQPLSLADMLHELQAINRELRRTQYLKSSSIDIGPINSTNTEE